MPTPKLGSFKLLYTIQTRRNVAHELPLSKWHLNEKRADPVRQRQTTDFKMSMQAPNQAISCRNKRAARVQHTIDSRNFAIRNAYRSSLRPSPNLEPRHSPLQRILLHTSIQQKERADKKYTACITTDEITTNRMWCEWSFRRFTYGNLVTTSPSSKW